jgi:hypothetical protein
MSRYVEAARTVLVGIDLDPASCETANRIVRFAEHLEQFGPIVRMRHYLGEAAGMAEHNLLAMVDLSSKQSLRFNNNCLNAINAFPNSQTS